MESLESMGFNLGMPGMPGVPTPRNTPKKKPDMQVLREEKRTKMQKNKEASTSTTASKTGSAPKKGAKRQKNVPI